MKKDTLLIGGAVVALILLIGYRNKNKQPENVLKSDDLGGGAGGGGALARENGGGAVMQTGVPVVVAPVTSTLRPQRIDTNTSSALNRANQFRSPIGLGSRPTSGGSNVQSAFDRATALAQRNFLTFDGDYAQKTGLDFEGNLD